MVEKAHKTCKINIMELDFSKRIKTQSNAAMLPSLAEVAGAYRAAQFIAHNFHNLVKGPTFLEDHEFLGELYGEYEEAYDGCIERIIAFTGAADVTGITTKACAAAAQINPNGKSSSDMFTIILGLERGFCALIKAAVPDCTDGTQNFLQGLADESEMRQYKISQKIR
jgi:DNA-binding ferritin-like protein